MITSNEIVKTMQRYTICIHIHTKDVYENITDHIEKIFDASNWVIERL